MFFNKENSTNQLASSMILMLILRTLGRNQLNKLRLHRGRKKYWKNPEMFKGISQV